MRNDSNTVRHNQNGMVSFLICMIMMIVITLVVLGFSQVSRNESKLTLNRQLSAAAFYAADSGINNAVAIITNDVNASPAVTPPDEASNCDSPANPYTANSKLDSTAIAYTCLTVNTGPKSLLLDVSTGSPAVFPVDAGTTATVNSITFSWDNGDASYAGCPAASGATSGTFTTAANWSPTGTPCDASVLELNLISAGNTLSLPAQETGAYNIFLYPTRKATATGSLSKSSVYDAACVNGRLCTATISGLPPDRIYYARLSSIYSDSNVTVCLNSGTACTVPLYNAQADVDSTGRAQGVLQRLDARVCIAQGLCSDATPAFAVQTGDSLCKLITGYPSDANNPTGLATIGSIPADNVPTNSTADTQGCSLN